MDKQLQAEYRLLVGVLFVPTCLGVAVSLTAFLPYLVRQHARLEPWKVVLIWIGDAMALFWFCKLVVVHLLMKKPFPDDQPISSGPNRAILGVVLFLALAMSIDLSATLALWYEEKHLFATALPAAGQVHAMSWREAASSTQYKLECRYSDQNNQVHETRFTLWDMKKDGLPAGMARATVQNVRGRQTPFPIQVSYDPDWPDRAWLTEAPFDDFDNLHGFSLMVLFFQGIALPLCLMPLYGHVKQYGAYPWWRDVYQAVPLMIEAGWLSLLGVVELATGRFSS